MEELHLQAIANSILECFPESIRTECYVEKGPNKRYLWILQRDGEGQTPLMSISDDHMLELYSKNKLDELDVSIKRGLERIGYRIKFSPVKVRSPLVYFLETNGTERH